MPRLPRYESQSSLTLLVVVSEANMDLKQAV